MPGWARKSKNPAEKQLYSCSCGQRVSSWTGLNHRNLNARQRISACSAARLALLRPRPDSPSPRKHPQNEKQATINGHNEQLISCCSVHSNPLLKDSMEIGSDSDSQFDMATAGDDSSSDSASDETGVMSKDDWIDWDASDSEPKDYNKESDE